MTMGSSNKEWNQQPENLNIKLSFVSFLPKPWCSTYRMLRPQRVKWWFWSAGSEEALLHRSGGTEKETRSWTPLTFGYYRKVSAAFCRLECFSCGCNYLLRDIFSVLSFSACDASEPRSAAEPGMFLFLHHSHLRLLSDNLIQKKKNNLQLSCSFFHNQRSDWICWVEGFFLLTLKQSVSCFPTPKACISEDNKRHCSPWQTIVQENVSVSQADTVLLFLFASLF